MTHDQRVWLTFWAIVVADLSIVGLALWGIWRLGEAVIIFVTTH